MEALQFAASFLDTCGRFILRLGWISISCIKLYFLYICKK
ncbi:hypothetical protein LEP1GSC125_2778 [Leptospira mayottensis 200901122]|uniref:Uncharacterized protein n=1 Tax=Leptospira mayottensis 200901122 TaxID=1193010 RepID=A0AA87MN90_9LEPT|nr:hypothetical protein LEP1GSC125_2778 [Leptospira mayottensis 200901122]